jgi:hypothetical protein
MTRSRLVTLAVAAAVLVVPALSGAARPETGGQTLTGVYTVSGLVIPGVDTGLVLTTGMSVSVSASGAICVSGTSICPGPGGTSSVDTTTSGYGGYVLPGAPAYGLIGRVGDGPWVQVGSGPTTLSGTGHLVFAVNDDFLPDNTGSFEVSVTVSYDTCFPGWGYGDANHAHIGPPGLLDTCYPGHGYGDANHVHAGPPGQSGKSDVSSQSGNKAGAQDDPTTSGPGKSESRGNRNH